MALHHFFKKYSCRPRQTLIELVRIERIQLFQSDRWRDNFIFCTILNEFFTLIYNLLGLTPLFVPSSPQYEPYLLSTQPTVCSDFAFLHSDAYLRGWQGYVNLEKDYQMGSSWCQMLTIFSWWSRTFKGHYRVTLHRLSFVAVFWRWVYVILLTIIVIRMWVCRIV